MLTLYQLKQLINIHTRTTETTSTRLDLIITQSPQIIKRVDVLPAICSDHNVPCAFLQNNITKNLSLFKRTMYNYNKLNSEKFCNLLSSIDWLNFTTGWTIDECTDLFTEIFTNIAKQCMPLLQGCAMAYKWNSQTYQKKLQQEIDSIVQPSGVNQQKVGTASDSWESL